MATTAALIAALTKRVAALEAKAKEQDTMVARLTPLLTFLPPAGADVTPPVITAQQLVNISNSSVTVSWTTNEASTSQVDWGTTTGYTGGPTTLVSALVTTHSVTVTGLSPSTLYHMRVRSKDAAGNEVVGTDMTTTTPASGTDTTAPVISNIAAVVGAGGTSVTVSWSLDEYATGQVFYGLTSALGQSSTKETSVAYNAHIQTIGSLTPNQTYYFKVQSTDASGNTATSLQQSFSTATTGGGVGPGTYDATFTGTGGDDTAALTAFIEGHLHLSLALIGTINVTSCAPSIPAGTTTKITWLTGAKLKCIAAGNSGVLKLINAYDLELWNPEIEGTSYNWAGVEDPLQTEDGIGLYGCRRVTITNAYIHDVRGDGIYNNLDDADGTSDAIAIVNSTLLRCSRNSLTVNGGQVTVTGGSWHQSGLHTLDLEPNTTTQGASIDLVMSGVDMADYNEFYGIHGVTGYCVGAEWGSGAGATKVRVDIQNCTAKKFTVALSNTAIMRFTGNVSQTLIDGGWAGGGIAPLEFINCGTKTPATAGGIAANNTNIQNPSPYS